MTDETPTHYNYESKLELLEDLSEDQIELFDLILKQGLTVDALPPDTPGEIKEALEKVLSTVPAYRLVEEWLHG